MKINRWKMAVLAWLAMFPFSTLLNYSFSEVSFTAHCPIFVRTFLLTCCLVPYMVFVVFPFTQQRFKRWLEIRPTQSDRLPVLGPEGAVDIEKG